MPRRDATKTKLAEAQAALIERGEKPTQRKLAAEAGMSTRTVKQWQAEVRAATGELSPRAKAQREQIRKDHRIYGDESERSEYESARDGGRQGHAQIGRAAGWERVKI